MANILIGVLSVKISSFNLTSNQTYYKAMLLPVEENGFFVLACIN